MNKFKARHRFGANEAGELLALIMLYLIVIFALIYCIVWACNGGGIKAIAATIAIIWQAVKNKRIFSFEVIFDD